MITKIDYKIKYQKIKDKDWYKKKQKKYYKSDKHQFYKYRKNASDRKIEWEISFEEFCKYWNGRCYYCGEKIDGIGLDRVDNKKGYTIKNIIPCCSKCNYMKGTLTKQDFIARCKKISMKKSCYCNTSRLML